METEENHPTPEDWWAWKKACAADLCEPDTARALRRFGAIRFAAQVKRVGRTASDVTDPWHLLESHCQVAKTRAGKRYKDWLFVRSDAMDLSWAAAVESGVSLLMRSAVREFLRREHSPSFMTSLHQPLGDGTFSLEDLLPDPASRNNTMEDAELGALVLRSADRISLSLDKIDCALLWARTHGVSFTDQRLAKKTKLGKSTLHERSRVLFERIARDLRQDYPNEHTSVLTDLTIRVFAELGNRAAEKLFPGKVQVSLL